MTTILLSVLLGASPVQLSSTLRGSVLRAPLTSAWLVNADADAVDRSAEHIVLAGVNTPTYGATGTTFDGTEYLIETVANWRAADTQGTWAAWINPSVLNAANTVIGTSDEGANNDFMILRVVSSGAISFWHETGGTATVITTDTGPVNTGSWQHIAIVSTGTNYLIYYNGVSLAFTAGSGTDSGAWLNDMVAGNRDNVTIGAYKRAAAAAQFTGIIADVRASSVAMTAPEMLELAKRPPG